MGSRFRAAADAAREYYRAILPFYELESISRAHVAFWRHVAEETAPERILEIGSGFGRITAALSRRAPAVGIDISLEMLAQAESLRPAAAGGVSFVAADLRAPPFRAAFDLVVAPGDPICHLTRLADRRRALRAAASVLRPGGRFVLEGLYRRRVSMEAPHRRVRHGRGVLEIEEAWFPVGLRDLWHARYRYRDRRPGAPDRRGEAAFVARAWPARGLRELFASCGLRVERICGDFDGSPFRASSPRLLVFARRPRSR